MDVNKLVFRFVRVSFSILILLLVLVGFVKIGTYCYDFGYRVFAEQPVDKEPGRDVTVEIKSGMSDRDIAKMLEQKGVIRDANISRKHCAVIFKNGAYYIKDLDSTNGIEYKGNRIDTKRIDEGDQFNICDFNFTFTYR